MDSRIEETHLTLHPRAGAKAKSQISKRQSGIVWGWILWKCLPVDIFQRDTQSNPSNDCEFRKFVGVGEVKQFHGCPAPRWHLTRLKEVFLLLLLHHQSEGGNEPGRATKNVPL